MLSVPAMREDRRGRHGVKTRRRGRLDLADMVWMPVQMIQAVAMMAGAECFQVLMQRVMVGAAFAVRSLKRAQRQLAFATQLLIAASLAAFAYCGVMQYVAEFVNGVGAAGCEEREGASGSVERAKITGRWDWPNWVHVVCIVRLAVETSRNRQRRRDRLGLRFRISHALRCRASSW